MVVLPRHKNITISVSRMRIKTIFAHHKFDFSIHIFAIDGPTLFITDPTTSQGWLFISASASVNRKQSLTVQYSMLEKKTKIIFH